ncbi:MAG: hypothetical protein IPO06_26030 [Leptospiraceae bacterium]|nr:hypothetical protein [Leptospiraceae bacterium]
MFTLSIPLFILLKNEEEDTKTGSYFFLTFIILILFLVKVIAIQKAQGLYNLGACKFRMTAKKYWSLEQALELEKRYSPH